MQSRLETAIEACWRAGKITLRYYQSHPSVEIKSDGSPVTVADREAEQEIRAVLSRHFPEDGIIGEESGITSPRNGGTWYVDPIDGTRSFIAGVPFYAVLLAYETGGETPLGVAYFPALDEMIWASKGNGCFWNGRRVTVSSLEQLGEATMLLTDFNEFYRRGYGEALRHLCEKTRLQRTWGDAYGHFLVATGRAEIMLDPIMADWDCAALMPIIEEAGGRFTDWKGNATIHGRSAISTNGALHDEVIQAFSERT